MNKLMGLLTALLFIFFFQTAMAETKYVTERMQITVRTGKSVQNKIIAMLDSGQRVNVLESDGDWSLVRLANGKEGWVLTRFLTYSEPNGIVLERLEKKHEVLKEQADILAEENKLLKAENQTLKSELVSNKESLEEMTKNYQTLEEESAEFIDLKAREEEARTKMQELDAKVEILETEASKSRMQQNIRWFLAGSGVLLAGFIIGTISKKKRRRSSLLM
ncbi:MAG: TIGR04211 family SH3 domain-containing protein [Desulfobacterales bacterium]